MRGCFGWLILMPIAGAFWLAVALASVFGKMGTYWRFVGVLFSFVVGGLFAGFTHLLFYGDTAPTSVFWWIGIIAAGIVTLLGTWTAVATPQGGK